jgi:hypothetical protein
MATISQSRTSSLPSRSSSAIYLRPTWTKPITKRSLQWITVFEPSVCRQLLSAEFGNSSSFTGRYGVFEPRTARVVFEEWVAGAPSADAIQATIPRLLSQCAAGVSLPVRLCASLGAPCHQTWAENAIPAPTVRAVTGNSCSRSRIPHEEPVTCWTISRGRIARVVFFGVPTSADVRATMQLVRRGL